MAWQPRAKKAPQALCTSVRYPYLSKSTQSKGMRRSCRNTARDASPSVKGQLSNAHRGIFPMLCLLVMRLVHHDDFPTIQQKYSSHQSVACHIAQSSTLKCHVNSKLYPMTHRPNSEMSPVRTCLKSHSHVQKIHKTGSGGKPHFSWE